MIGLTHDTKLDPDPKEFAKRNHRRDRKANGITAISIENQRMATRNYSKVDRGLGREIPGRNTKGA